jgi:hypothetical protein
MGGINNPPMAQMVGLSLGLPHNYYVYECACGGEAATDHIAHLVHDLRTTPQGAKPRYEWI